MAKKLGGLIFGHYEKGESFDALDWIRLLIARAKGGEKVLFVPTQ